MYPPRGLRVNTLETGYIGGYQGRSSINPVAAYMFAFHWRAPVSKHGNRRGEGGKGRGTGGRLREWIRITGPRLPLQVRDGFTGPNRRGGH